MDSLHATDLPAALVRPCPRVKSAEMEVSGNLSPKRQETLQNEFKAESEVRSLSKDELATAASTIATPLLEFSLWVESLQKILITVSMTRVVLLDDDLSYEWKDENEISAWEKRWSDSGKPAAKEVPGLLKRGDSLSVCRHASSAGPNKP